MRHLLVLLLSLLLVACSSGDRFQDLRDYVQEVESQPKGKIPPPPEFQAYEFFTYSAVNLRAPFERPVEVELIQQEAPSQNVSPNFDRVKERLEEFRFDTLNMVGTIAMADGQLWGLVEDSESDVHKVRIGNYLGKNHGRIVNVGGLQIDVMEIVPDGQGGWLERPRTLLLLEENNR